jgi:threonine/homoserine/homoserine lactone efflux protein
MAIEILWIFIPFMIVAAASPGPDVLYVVSRSLGAGRWAPIVASGGIATGLCVLSLAAALGLGQLFTIVPLAYDAMKYLGAAYLLYLAIKIIQSDAAGQGDTVAAQPLPLWDVYVQGLLTNLLNPKAIIFFMAVLPQFTNPAAGDVRWQMAAFAGMAVLIAFTTHSVIGLSAQRIARYLRRPSRLQAAIQKYLLAGLFAAVAMRLALSQRP